MLGQKVDINLVAAKNTVEDVKHSTSTKDCIAPKTRTLRTLTKTGKLDRKESELYYAGENIRKAMLEGVCLVWHLFKR